jgi:hypothetical protein
MNKPLFECHITIEPVTGERRDMVENVAAVFGFKLAKLFMQTGVESKLDTFMTAHDTDYETLKRNMRFAIEGLKYYELKVHRYKIEQILLDSRTEDVLNMISPKETDVKISRPQPAHWGEAAIPFA